MCNSKSIRIYQNQHLDFLRFLSTGDYLKTEWDLEQVTCQAIFYVEF